MTKFVSKRWELTPGTLEQRTHTTAPELEVIVEIWDFRQSKLYDWKYRVVWRVRKKGNKSWSKIHRFEFRSNVAALRKYAEIIASYYEAIT